MHSVVCAYCGAGFTTKDRRQRFCGRACTAAYQSGLYARPLVAVTCAHCGGSFAVKQSLVATARFCSRVCKDAHHSAVGVVTLACTVCGKSFTRKASKRGDYCSYACMGVDSRRPIDKVCEYCGKAYQSLPNRADKSRFCSRRCRVSGLAHAETKPERAVEQALREIGVAYLAQHPILSYTIDFYLPLHSLALEVDGVFWHSRPGVPERDHVRDARLAQVGITTVRITDVAIAATPNLAKFLRKLLHL